MYSSSALRLAANLQARRSARLHGPRRISGRKKLAAHLSLAQNFGACKETSRTTLTHSTSVLVRTRTYR